MKHFVIFLIGFIIVLLAIGFCETMFELGAWASQHMTREGAAVALAACGGVLAVALMIWLNKPTKL